MKNSICLLFVLLFQLQLRAQTEAAKPTATVQQRDTSAAMLSEILEMGFLLAATGKYGDARDYFVYVADRAPSKQVHNNAGIAAVMDALEYFRPGDPEIRFRYPIQLDLQGTATRDLKDLRDNRTLRLKAALRQFDAAIKLDTLYAPAYLNKACVYTLLGDTNRARILADTVKTFPGYDKTAGDAQVLIGILHALQGDSAKAYNIFQNAAKSGNSLANYNLNMLTGALIEKLTSALRLGKPESVAGLSLNDSYSLPEEDPGSEIAVSEQIRFFHNLDPGPGARYYFSDNAGTGAQSYFLITRPDYPGQTARKRGIGATRAAVEEAYKQPLRTIETLTGEILVYPTILLVLGKDGALVQWAIYGDTP
ncbi:MAG: sel1 repeat family protein [Lewinellaceae bacterium]|nr:sel1 repeat family protein [Lewinellaceae bacterium]